MLGDGVTIEAVLADHKTAPIDAKLRATLDLLQKVSHEPAAFGRQDILVARRAGVSDGQIRDALHVMYLFSVYTRCADTLGFDMPQDGYRMAKFILTKAGYK